MTGFALLLLLCIAIPLGVALLFLAILIHSNRPSLTYRTWVRNARRSWRADGNAMKRVKPRQVDIDVILADSEPVLADPLLETREMVENARSFYDASKQRARPRAKNPVNVDPASQPHAWERQESTLAAKTEKKKEPYDKAPF